MINPVVNPLEHKKQFEEIKKGLIFSKKKHKNKDSGNSPSITTTVSQRHHDFINDLKVDFTIRHRKSYNNSQILRAIIEYAENFRDEIFIFFETKHGCR